MNVTASELPEFAFKQYPITEESRDDVHYIIEKAAQLVYPEPTEARALIVKALERVNKGAEISEYDYLWTQYGLLKSSFETGTSDYGPGTQEDYLKIAANVLDFLDNKTSVGEWVFTEEGAFRMEVYRVAGNGLAWETMELTDDKAELEKALEIINKTEVYMGSEENYYILDTKVRVLMKLKKQQEAFEIVEKVLDEIPDFGDFQDFYENDDYQKWLETK